MTLASLKETAKSVNAPLSEDEELKKFRKESEAELEAGGFKPGKSRLYQGGPWITIPITHQGEKVQVMAHPKYGASAHSSKNRKHSLLFRNKRTDMGSGSHDSVKSLAKDLRTMS